MRKVSFVEKSISELNEYKNDGLQKLVFRVFDLLADIEKIPFTGLGKPEALKGNLQGWWSRRVSDEHRLLYKVTDDEIEILSCKSHDYSRF
jgi:toxin YoeB